LDKPRPAARAPLRVGVRHRDDARPGVLLRHPQGQGSPSAPQFEHVHAILYGGVVAAQLQHGAFRGRQPADAFGPKAGTVFEMRAEDVFEEDRRHLVMLGIGRVGVRRDGPARQGFEKFLLPVGAYSVEFGETLVEQTTYPSADRGLREQPTFHQFDGESRQRGLDFGNHGKNALVVA